MDCKKGDVIKLVEELTTLLPYQKQMLRIQLCNTCNVRHCKERLADKDTLANYCAVLPRHYGHPHRYMEQIMELSEAHKRAIPQNVIR